MLVLLLASLLFWAVILMTVGFGWWPVVAYLLTAVVVAVALRQIDPDWPVY